MAAWAADLSGPSDPTGTRPLGAPRSGGSLVWAADAGRVATAGPLGAGPADSGEVQTWYARMVHLIDQYRLGADEAGKFARTLDREMRACGRLW